MNDDAPSDPSKPTSHFMPQVENKVTVANLIQIALLLVGLALGWAALDARSQAAQADLSDHEARLRTPERDVMSGLARIEQRMIQLERVIQ